MKDPRRWLLIVAVAAALGWLAANRNRETVKSGAGHECLVHSDCAKSLRCYVEPNDDGFATFGTCVDLCVDDLQCPAGAQCGMTAQGQQQLVRVKPGLQPGERVCVKSPRTR